MTTIGMPIANYDNNQHGPNENLQFGAWTATTQGDVGPGSKVGWGLSADYPNDLLDCNASVNQFGIALEPLLGFLPRPGRRRTDAFCAYQPRPSKNGPFRWIRQEFFENEYVRYTDPQGILESWEYFMAPINVRFETGDYNDTNDPDLLDEYFSNVRDRDSATPVNVTIGADTPDVDATLELAGSISGVVYGPDGTTNISSDVGSDLFVGTISGRVGMAGDDAIAHGTR